MALPEQEKYRVKELADEWSISEGIVEDYLEAGKLTASVVLTRTVEYLRWFELGEIPFKNELDFDDPWLYAYLEAHTDESIDTEAQDLIYETNPGMLDSGLYHINRYDLLEWDSKSECDLKRCCVRLTTDGSPNYFYVFEKSKIINKDQIRITRRSIDRFLKNYCGDDTTLPAKLPVLTFPNIPSRLKAAFSVWEALYYSGKLSGEPKRGNDHKGHVRQWLIENYSDVVEYPTLANKSECNDTILDAIYKVITENPSTLSKKKSKN